MSSDVLRRLTDKKGKQLSTIFGIVSEPDTSMIANLKDKINNPIFNLSVTDYERMCENKMMTKMMSKVIGCEEKQLKKFCKYINVFADNIKSSPKSIKNKMKVTNSINASNRKGSLNVLPDDILDKIVKKYKTLFKIKYKLKDWIPLDKLNWGFLSLNPDAIELLKENPDKIEWIWLSSNPNAIELLKEKIDEENKMDKEYLKKLPSNKKIDYSNLSENVNSIELLRENPKNINWMRLSANPSAIGLLKANLEKIHWRQLSRNINAMELLEDNLGKINWTALARNPNNRAIELLKANPKKIDWIQLSKNPAAIKLLKKKPNYIDWHSLSRNTNIEAIKLLKANREKIDWNWLSENPNAIELLKERIVEENEMNEEYLKNLPSNKKINWKELSKNPSIFEIILV